MKVSCERAALLTGIQTVQKAVSSRSTLQILGNVLVETRDDSRLRLTAYDLEIGIETSFHAAVHRPGAVTIPARVLGEVVGILPDAEVTLDTDDRQVTQVTCHRSKYRLHGLPAEEFPRLPQIDGSITVTLAAEKLARMVRQTRFAASVDDPRKVLMGILTMLDDTTIQLVATDGYRLALARDTLDTAVPERTEAIVPARAYGEVARLTSPADESVHVTMSANQVRFGIGDASVQSRLIEGQYPNWERVVPAAHTRSMELDAQELIQAAKRVAIVAREDGNKVIFDVSEGNLMLTAESQLVGSAQEQVPVRFDGEPITVGFNSRYLLQLLEIVEVGDLRFEFREADSPVVVRPGQDERYMSLLMPMGVTAH